MTPPDAAQPCRECGCSLRRHNGVEGMCMDCSCGGWVTPPDAAPPPAGAWEKARERGPYTPEEMEAVRQFAWESDPEGLWTDYRLLLTAERGADRDALARRVEAAETVVQDWHEESGHMADSWKQCPFPWCTDFRKALALAPAAGQRAEEQP